jgi:5S rRNA maturation endonuclease (ribonuclease M5)
MAQERREDAESAARRIAMALGGKEHAVDGASASYLCRCPAHDDANPSLSVTVKGGKLLAHCFAGCSFQAVFTALKGLGLIKESKGGEAAGAGAQKKKPKRKVEAEYPYTDAKGSVLFKKIRLEGKGFWTSGPVADVLYRAHVLETLRGATGARLVICEGEKDADNVNSLGVEGLVATTNHGGGSSWGAEYSEQCRGFREITICEDNDATGRERTARIVSSFRKEGISATVRIARFEHLPQKSDVSDWLAGLGDVTPEEKRGAFLRLIAEAQEPGEDIGSEVREGEGSGARWLRMQEGDRARADEYPAFVESLPGVKGLKRCLVTDELMALYRGEWISAQEVDVIRYVTAHARDFGKFFQLTAFEEMLERFRTDVKVPELLCESVEWDGRDRIREMSEVFRFRNISSEVFYELILQWGATIYRRLDNPAVQPITPIFQGGQGIGKDSLIAALTGGLGRYTKKLEFSHYEAKEARRMLHTGLVFLVPEFDKLARTDIATLKDILTTDTTDQRLPYERKDRTRKVRASFIASCNVPDILVDHTGNRRFWLFECEYLGIKPERKPYPGVFFGEGFEAERLQIQAQFRAAKEAGFYASTGALRAMEEVIEDATPDNPNDILVEVFSKELDATIVTPCKFSPVDGAPLWRVSKIIAVFEDVAKRFGKSVNSVQRIVAANGLRERLRDGRYYRGRKIGDCDASMRHGDTSVPDEF